MAAGLAEDLQLGVVRIGNGIGVAAILAVTVRQVGDHPEVVVLGSSEVHTLPEPLLAEEG